MIIVFTGNGKGKTSASLGIALRASGWGKKVAIIQLIKGYKKIGEWKAIQKISNIEIFQFLDDKNLSISKPTDQHKISMPKAISKINELVDSGEFQIIILDEINNAFHFNLLEVNTIIPILLKHPEIDFIFTGRDAPEELIKMADLVTEMKEIKHPFQKNTPAKKGIDY